jgi:hypothetical protein
MPCRGATATTNAIFVALELTFAIFRGLSAGSAFALREVTGMDRVRKAN